MAARKKKRELSEKAQKRIRQRNLHVGITVRDIERTTAFYTKYFGFQLEYYGGM